MRRARTRTAAAGAVLASLLLAACGTASGDGGDEVTLTYWLWDANQQPAQEQCAEAFEAQHPDINIKIEQRGWDFYWSALTLGMVSEAAPDVFTDHLARYPDYVTRGLLLPLDEFAERDNLQFDIYEEGLADLWIGPDGHRYGLPKDFDAIALFYNKDMAREAGITEEQMNNLTWNPEDGGTFEDVIARLTVDENGVRGDEPGFDKNNVRTYGIWPDRSGGDSHGQTQWSYLAATNGFTYTDENPWGTEYHYGDESFLEVIGWLRGLIEKGYAPSWEQQEGVTWSDQLAAGRTAMASNGSWMTGTVFGYENLNAGIAPTPIGPSGERATMFNGLADSIYAGTEHPEEAWEWVRFLGSAECQRLVAEHGVVLPAVSEAREVAERTFAEAGIDIAPFTQHVEDGTTVLYPITEHPTDVLALLRPALEAVLSGQQPVESLRGVNQEINELFE